MSGNAIEADGQGYYKIDASITVAPTAAEPVTVALYSNGVQVPGAIATGTAATAGDAVALPITATIRQGCCCDNVDALTFVLLEGAGTVQNISARVEKV